MHRYHLHWTPYIKLQFLVFKSAFTEVIYIHEMVMLPNVRLASNALNLRAIKRVLQRREWELKEKNLIFLKWKIA